MKSIIEIKDLIKKGDAESALRELSNHISARNKRFEREIIHLTKKLNELQSDNRKGILQHSEYNIEKAKITNSILEIVDKIEQKASLQEGVTKSSKGIFNKIIIAVFSITFLICVCYFLGVFDNGSALKSLSFEEITSLANEYKLNNRKGVNEHLSFSIGDFNFWVNKNLSREDVKLQFDARKRILDNAEKENRKIETQGDLANEAEILIIREIASKYNLDTRRSFNSHLLLDDGDFSYWKDQQLSLKELERRFRTMDEVLKNAEKNKIKIETKGDLGYLVEEKLKK